MSVPRVIDAPNFGTKVIEELLCLWESAAEILLLTSCGEGGLVRPEAITSPFGGLRASHPGVFGSSELRALRDSSFSGNVHNSNHST